VALVALEVPDSELKRLAEAGFRGVRFNFMSAEQAASASQVMALTRRLAPLGMHLQVQLEGHLIGELAPLLKQSAVPVVIDHMARLDAVLGSDQPGYRVLCKLLEDPRFHVKVSGADRLSPPPYTAGAALARRLVENFPDRCFWGTDWPHPFHDHVPDDGRLVDLLAEIAPSAAARQALLVDNPQRFYRFEDLPAG
jgi:2-pyrone-4,6-dicarboxylate lactonase